MAAIYFLSSCELYCQHPSDNYEQHLILILISKNFSRYHQRIKLRVFWAWDCVWEIHQIDQSILLIWILGSAGILNDSHTKGLMTLSIRHSTEENKNDTQTTPSRSSRCLCFQWVFFYLFCFLFGVFSALTRLRFI